MSRDLVNDFCARQPGAEWSDPWGDGHDCWKVGGKIFALLGASRDSVAIKTAGVEVAELLIETGVAEPARYFHKSWVAMPLDSAPDELVHRVRSSYKLIRDTLPRKIRDTLVQV